MIRIKSNFYDKKADVKQRIVGGTDVLLLVLVERFFFAANLLLTKSLIAVDWLSDVMGEKGLGWRERTFQSPTRLAHQQ